MSSVISICRTVFALQREDFFTVYDNLSHCGPLIILEQTRLKVCLLHFTGYGKSGEG